jgi:protein-tyrosine phosphatase
MLGVAQVRPHLLFGSAPQGREDVEELARRGVTAVLCLQTDDDLAQYGLRWSAFEGWYAHRGIITRRVPILDFSPDAIIAHLDETLGALAALLNDGHTVYVYCSAGLNRSPTIVIAHLVRAEGRSLAEARDVVATARPAVQPYERALDAIRVREESSR